MLNEIIHATPTACLFGAIGIPKAAPCGECFADCWLRLCLLIIIYTTSKPTNQLSHAIMSKFITASLFVTSSLAYQKLGGDFGTPFGPGDMGIPSGLSGMGIPAGAGSMGIPAGAGSMGIPTGPGSMGIPSGVLPRKLYQKYGADCDCDGESSGYGYQTNGYRKLYQKYGGDCDCSGAGNSYGIPTGAENSYGIPSGLGDMGIPAGAGSMGIPTGAGSMGIPSGVLPRKLLRGVQ